MTVKELITELLDYDMNADVKLKIKYANLDDEIEDFTIEPIYRQVGSDDVEIVVDFEDFNYHDRIAFEEEE